MSTNLYYEPAVDKQKYLGKSLKYVIAPIVWGHDGTLHGEPELVKRDTTFYRGDDSIVLYQFLKGIAARKDDAAQEAKTLIELIDKYDSVFISLKD